MKNNFLFCNNNIIFFRNHSLKIFILTLLFSVNVNSQVSCYAFAESAGSYTALSSSTNVFSSGWNDNITGAISIGFAFNFNGTDYTSCFVNSNGYITFGAASVYGNYNPISSGTSSGSISAFGRDLTNNSSPIVRGVEGSAPNRVFVVQWNNARRVSDPFWIFSGSAVTGDNLNFQIRLYETTNQIEVKYGNCVLASDVYEAQVGLKGASNGDFNNRRLTSASL
ncbi:hypothetical protein [Flavobacterium macacae]|uniref:T9SS C-terminal target domain-containing protein n=1 Tax=Flavobacterium macacae TaxID=2488993 RepID=A0A3P3WER9_9FLAO|nr:hypothetical protein [Flavobacterium macacae]RRJ92566.1 hypothetical protein EG849_06175 [Flavobacterium macacae]